MIFDKTPKSNSKANLFFFLEKRIFLNEVKLLVVSNSFLFNLSILSKIILLPIALSSLIESFLK